MKYIVDTDILIYFLNNVQNVVIKFNEIDSEIMATTIINYAELLFGAYNSQRVERNLAKVRPFLEILTIVNFNKNAGNIFAQLKTTLKKRGNIIADMDLMIASICLANNCILVTNNFRHFQRIDDLQIENWA